MTESLLERLAEHQNGGGDQSACTRSTRGKIFRFMVVEDPARRKRRNRVERTVRTMPQLKDSRPGQHAPRMQAWEQERGEDSMLFDRWPIAELVLLAALAAFAVPALPAQTRPDELRFHVGTATFFEAEQHVTLGGSYRMYLGRRGWGIEPEFSAMIEPDHSDNVMALSVVKDLSRPAAKRIWYIIMGGGINHQRGDRSSRTGLAALSWGVGMKMRAGRRWYIAPQTRIGFEPNIRFSLFLGWATE